MYAFIGLEYLNDFRFISVFAFKTCKLTTFLFRFAVC